jgi:hypothetical protein
MRHSRGPLLVTLRKTIGVTFTPKIALAFLESPIQHFRDINQLRTTQHYSRLDSLRFRRNQRCKITMRNDDL